MFNYWLKQLWRQKGINCADNCRSFCFKVAFELRGRCKTVPFKKLHKIGDIVETKLIGYILHLRALNGQPSLYL